MAVEYTGLEFKYLSSFFLLPSREGYLKSFAHQQRQFVYVLKKIYIKEYAVKQFWFVYH